MTEEAQNTEKTRREDDHTVFIGAKPFMKVCEQ